MASLEHSRTSLSALIILCTREVGRRDTPGSAIAAFGGARFLVVAGAARGATSTSDMLTRGGELGEGKKRSRRRVRLLTFCRSPSASTWTLLLLCCS